MVSRVSSSRRRIAAVALVLAVLAVFAVFALAASAAPDGGTASCVAVRSEARYVPYGWSHVVVLASACTTDATCTVSTDVNPEKQGVVVPRGATVEVITFLASPSQVFRPQVACTLR